jgi:hypothetical protein
MVRLTVQIVLSASLVLLATTLMSRVHAQTAGDVTYEGLQEAGGPVRLVVSADGARVVVFEVEGIAGGGCSWDTITLENWGGEIAIVEGQFSSTNADGDVLGGYLIESPDGPPRLEGMVKVRDPVKGCETPPLRWVATPAP